MSQRNPMNDRYQTDEHQGKTRKSAAAMKPKTKPASTVRIQPQKKTKEQKKIADKEQRRAERARQKELDRRYYTPPTERYKRLRRIWWGLIIASVVMIVVALLLRDLNETLSFVFLGLVYALMLLALYFEFGKIRKERKQYQEQMAARKAKELRAYEKEQKAAERARQQAAEQEAEKKPEDSAPAKKGLFGSGFRLSKRGEQTDAKTEEQ